MYGALPPLLRTSSWRGAKLSPTATFVEDRVEVSDVPRGVWGVQPPPEIPKALQNRAKLAPIVKTVKNC